MSDSVQPHRWQLTRLRRVLQARTLEWVAISSSNAWKWKVKVKSLSCVWLFATPWTAAYQAPPSMGFSRQEYWSGVPLPSPIFGLQGGNIFRQCSCVFSLKASPQVELIAFSLYLLNLWAYISFYACFLLYTRGSWRTIITSYLFLHLLYLLLGLKYWMNNLTRRFRYWLVGTAKMFYGRLVRDILITVIIIQYISLSIILFTELKKNPTGFSLRLKFLRMGHTMHVWGRKEARGKMYAWPASGNVKWFSNYPSSDRIRKGNVLDFLGSPVVKNPSANAGDVGSVPGLGRPHMMQGN